VTPDSYVVNAAIPNSACNSCHGIGSSGGSSIKLDTHFSTNYTDPTTGTLLDANCVECHNPMSAQSNNKLIRNTVRGRNVIFTAQTGANSFADGDTVYDGICEVCHTQTNHHRNDGLAPAQSHNNGGNCTICHTHPGGFTDQLAGVNVPAPHDTADCAACHVTPDTYAPDADIPNSACLGCHDGSQAVQVDTHFSDNYTDPTTGALMNANCVECHNPMSEQTNMKLVRSLVRGNPVVFTAYTGANSFADGDTTYDGICEVCHTQTNHHQNDGSAPAQNHNNGVDCRTCHAHLGGFQPDVNIPAPHDAAACEACHVTPDTYVPNAAIPNSACLSCHDGSGAAQVDTHFSDNYIDPSTGSLMNADCVECHNPMTEQTNLKFIRSSVRGSQVVFTAYSGANSFADGDTIYDGICEVCHTQTNHHRNNGTAPQQSHNDGMECTLCHDHLGGLQPSGGCTICHSEPQGNRVAIVDQFGGDSHHIQGVELTDEHCYQCHWEANSDGSISAYHGGPGNPGSVINLVIYGNGSRPTSYNVGTTAVEYTAGGSSGGGGSSVAVGNDPADWPYNTTSQSSASRVYVDTTNPANADGTIDTFEMYVTGGSGSIKIFTASLNGNTITPRAVATVNIQGTNRINTWTDLNLGVQTGDVIGFYGSSLQVRRDNSGTGNYSYSNSTSSSPQAGVSISVAGSSSRRIAVSATGGGGAVSGGRAEIQKINQVCLGCHSAQNDNTQPFGDGKTPREYAWDGMSIDARYSQTGTTPWGKYSDTSSTDITPKNTQTKAYSAHGNAAANERGWNLSETWPNTSGAVNVVCFDCHNSHGSTVSGTTTSYNSATANGAILKDTIEGKGGYAMTYQPQAGGSAADNNAHNAGAGLCFDCHMTDNSGVTPWGYSDTFGASQAIMGYSDTMDFGPGLAGAQLRYTFRQALAQEGGHFGASAPMTTSVNGTINGLCTPCHDPHGVSPTVNQQYSVPLLKGTWMTSPYKEDVAPASTNECVGDKDGRSCNGSTPGYHIDQNTFANWDYNSTASVSESDIQFAGLCLTCHTEASLNPNSTSTWRSVDRIHNSVKGWDNDGSTKHRYTCSKCHTPHNAALGRLLKTNCLDSAHRGQVESGGRGFQSSFSDGRDKDGRGSFPAGGGGWGEEGGGSWFFGTNSGGRACHENENNDSFPDDQLWNTVSPWGQLGGGGSGGGGGGWGH